MQELEEKAKECGLRVDDQNGDALENMANLGKNAYIYFMPNSSKDDKWAFCIGWDKCIEGLRYDVSTHDCDDKNKVICNPSIYKNSGTIYWPLGWDSFGRLDDSTNWKELTKNIIDKLTTEFRDTEEHIKEVEAAEKKCIP
jgi:hypothetical protein